MGKNDKKRSVFSLKRMLIRARLEKPLNLKRMATRALSGVLASVSLLASTACEPIDRDVFDGMSEYSTGDVFWLDEVAKTDNYFLIKWNGTLHLTKRLSQVNEEGLLYHRYYDVKTREFVGVSTDRHKEIELIGEYGYEQVVPCDAVVSLEKFVHDDIPSSEDLGLWMSDSDEARREFDEGVLEDYGIFAECKCSKKDGTEDVFIGHLLSNKSIEEPAMYLESSYIYDIFDGCIHYVGIYDCDEYSKVEMYSLDNSEVLEEYRRLHGESNEPVESESPEALEEEIEKLPNIGLSWGPIYETYEDVIVVDIASLDLLELEHGRVEEGLRYLFLIPKESDYQYIVSCKDILNQNAIVTCSKTLSDLDYISANSYFMSNEGVDAYGVGIFHLDEFLAMHGDTEKIKDSYTFSDIASLHEEYNPDVVYRVEENDVIVVDMFGVEGEGADYRIMMKEKSDYLTLYRDVYDSSAYVIFNGNEDEAIYCRLGAPSVPFNKNEWVYGLNEFLAARGLEDYIKEGIYSEAELCRVQEAITTQQKSTKRIEFK